MSNSQWTWADLSNKQLGLVAEAERTLGPDYLLAYRAGGQAAGPGNRSALDHVKVAALNDSQVECLQGLEKQLQAVVVAYRQNGP